MLLKKKLIILEPSGPSSWILSPPLDGMLVHPKVTPQHFTRLPLQFTGWREALFVQEHNTLTQPGLQPRSLDP